MQSAHQQQDLEQPIEQMEYPLPVQLCRQDMQQLPAQVIELQLVIGWARKGTVLLTKELYLQRLEERVEVIESLQHRAKPTMVLVRNTIR